MDDDELEQIRRRKMQQLQEDASLQDQDFTHEQANALEEQKKAVLRQILEPDARERLGRIKMARPELAASVEQQIIMLAQSGRLGQKIDDATLQQVLAKLTPKKKEISITHK